MIGSLWTRLRPAALMVSLGLCFCLSASTTGFSQDPPAEAAEAAAPAETAEAPAEEVTYSVPSDGNFLFDRQSVSVDFCSSCDLHAGWVCSCRDRP